MPISKDRVSYYYDPDVGSTYFGPKHPMKPHRLCMTHALVLAYKIHEKLEVYKPRRVYPVEMATFHSEDYIDFLNRITPDNQHEYMEQLQRFNLAEDCPIFDNLFEFCRIYTGGSMDGAVRLNHGQCDVAINWAGGLHHAKRAEASGFCYINDLVLAILELLKYHARVLYIDIDIHHGDGVEEAFYTTDRVMTLSFHKYGDYFFPGTGDLKDVGSGRGKYYSMNVPLKDGLDDASFQRLFKPILTKVMEVYQPGAVVIQCGADSLSHDRLGCFNLSLDGHAECIRFIKKFKVPLMVTGGGGYTKSNVARCWAFETAVVTETKLKDDIPLNDYYEYFADGNYKLKLQPQSIVDNTNSKAYMTSIKQSCMEHLRAMEHAPGVQMQEIPPDHFLPTYDEDADEDDPDQRISERDRDKMVVRDNEFYDDVATRL
mmetsp:Transcript_18038/g.39400  ORF Transcript_18038/g.39400 Transcript_18038/m.39400 type:complete len:430 (-) Transcript_18038:364-1653(-)|eukprot:CAMPEP_0118937552 /NCGR_PEP_ID=MMETSP1169-20130426/23127_1 /TAXON_ID=36882 /ORGANISM="Pyramimonas obovata, Strain CCMP722" /LENGTH=429 /DNA_ID=CAMNT_0006881225 /DNA_START=247 /DNA_END=1536 /DNA_ORIENTATION=+